MGNTYENEKGVHIETHTDKNNREHISFYDKDPKLDDHKSIHINWDSSTGKGTIVDTTSGEKETTDVGCFLTTACMRHMQETFDDNCKELTILRWFRDNFGKREDVEHYYNVAPIIVQQIESSENSNSIYNYIYENMVKSCVDAIENKNYEEAYNKYKNTVLVLEEEFVKPKLQHQLTKTLKYKTN